MELLQGRDLEAELQARGRLPIRELVGYVLQAASAIHEAHLRGVSRSRLPAVRTRSNHSQ